MIAAEILPIILVIALIWSALVAIVILAAGRRFERFGSGLAASAWLAVAAAIGLCLNGLVEAGSRSAAWRSDWISTRTDGGSIHVGILQDHAGLVMSALLALMEVLLLSCPRDPAGRSDRHPAALALALAGATLAWTSLTPWLAFVGIGLATLGGFLALGARWELEPDAALATRFLWQRSGGLTLAFLGACGLASTGMPLDWATAGAAPAGADPVVAAFGTGLLLAGLAIQFQPFPLAGWLTMPSQSPALHRISLGQVFPAWAAFAVIFRLEPSLRGQPLFTGFGAVLLASTFLNLLSAFCQESWRPGLGLWFSAAFTFSSALLVFAGPWSALAFLAATTAGGLALAMAGAALESGGSSSNSNRSRATWSKVSAIGGALAATGFLGWASSAAAMHWAPSALGRDPLLFAAFTFIAFLFIIQGAKLGLRISRLKAFTAASWVLVLSPLLLILATMSWAWTGAITGGAVPGSPDAVLPSLLDWITGTPAATGGVADEGTFWTATGIHWAAFVVAWGVAFWAAGQTRILAAEGSARSFADFLSKAYRFDDLASAFVAGLRRAGEGLRWLVDDRAWRNWIPAGLATGVRSTGELAARGDEQVTRRLREGVRHAVDFPAKGLQLLQSGDVQWYLIFAIGSGVAILLYFLRFRGT